MKKRLYLCSLLFVSVLIFCACNIFSEGQETASSDGVETSTSANDSFSSKENNSTMPIAINFTDGDIALDKNFTAEEALSAKSIIKNGDYLYYVIFKDYTDEKSLIIKSKTDKSDRQEFYKDSKGLFIGRTLMNLSEDLMLVSVGKGDYSGDVIILNLKNKTQSEFIDVSNLNKTSIFGVILYKDEYYFQVACTEEAGVSPTEFDLYKKNETGNLIKLVEKMGVAYYINDNKIFFEKDEIIYSMDCNGDNIKAILKPDKQFYGFNIYHNLLFIQYDASVVEIYDLKANTKKISDIKYNVCDILFDEDFYYCYINSDGLYKISYNGENNIKLSDLSASSITKIDDWIYFYKHEYDESDSPYFDALYRIKPDGTSLELFDYTLR